MAGLDSARLRKWADELDADERADRERAIEERIAELERERANGSSSSSSSDAQATIAELRQRLDALEAADDRDPESSSSSSSSSSSDDGGAPPTPKTRPGRKRGMVYAGADGMGYVYDGDDEPDEVPLDGDDEDDE